MNDNTKIFRFRVWKKNGKVFCENDIYVQPIEKFKTGYDEFLEFFKTKPIVKILTPEDNTISFFSNDADELTKEWRSIHKGIQFVQNFDNQFVFAEMN